MTERAAGAHAATCWLLLASVLSALWPAAMRVRAEEAAVPARIVVLEARAIEAQVPDLEDALRELLGRLELELSTDAGAAHAGRVVAHVEIVPAGDGAVVMVRGFGLSGPRVRRAVDAGSSPALFRETLAHVVLGAVEGFASEPGPEVSAEASPQPAAVPMGPLPVPPVAARSRSHASYALTAHGGPLWLARGRATAAFAAGLGVGFDAPLAPSLTFDVGGALPLEVGRAGVDATLGLIALRVTPRLRVLEAARVALEVGARGGLDVVTFTPTDAARGTLRGEPSRRLQPVLGPCLAARLRLSSSVALVLSTGTDVDLAPRRWVVAEGPAQRRLFELSRLRPYAYLGVAWTMLSPLNARAGGAP